MFGRLAEHRCPRESVAMKIVFVGHSHIGCVTRAAEKVGGKVKASVAVVQLRNPVFSKTPTSGKVASAVFAECDQGVVARYVSEATLGATLTVLCPTGNEHSASSIANNAENQPGLVKKRIEKLTKNYHCWLQALGQCVRSPFVVLPPPPPIESEAFILANPGKFSAKLDKYGVAPAYERLNAWRYQKSLIKNMADACGMRLIDLPKEVYSNEGFLHEQFMGKDPTHGNDAYGELLLNYVIALANNPELGFAAPGRSNQSENLETEPVPAATPGKRQHPYVNLPDRSFWKQAVEQVPCSQFDPVTEVPFKISVADKVATAGSCFAQHISKKIRSAGFQFMVTEHPASAANDGELRGFYDFSARYGNIYTARQLQQLIDRAFGYFSPIENHWPLPGNRFCDPFRPRIEPDGFPTVRALLEDRRRHLKAVREMFLQLDVFVFTLGLTECWVSRLDGAAYPVAPGVAGGTFDSSRYEFVNFNVNEVVSDLQQFIRKLRLVNPGAKLILTVSPVPLTATYEKNNVLVATTYSKSVLRVAAEMVSQSCSNVYYFPSFEIITGNYNRGRYFGPDLRSVTTEGVDHVMTVFMRHLTEGGTASGLAAGEVDAGTDLDREAEEMMALAEAACDEELLERK